MTTADWIKRRRELLDAATPGPWVTTADGADTLSAGFNPDGRLCLYAGFGWDDDAALIADARTSLPLALDALEAVLATLPPVGAEKFGRDFEAGVAKGSQLARAAIDTALRGES